MSNSIKTYAITDSFNLSGLIDFLCGRYRALGYETSITQLGNAVELRLARNVGGLWVLTGMGEQLSLTFSIDGSQLTCMFSGDSYTDKIVAFVVGWFCLQILWIFAAVGLYRQIKLPDNVDAAIYQYIIGNRT